MIGGIFILLKRIFKLFVELSGNKVFSAILVKTTTSKWSKYIIPLFVKVYKIDKDEMELHVSDYESLHLLFTRKLKSGSRRIASESNCLISPVDGMIRDFGRINDSSRFPVKNTEIDLTEMLGSDEKAQKYKNGHYIIFYLSPQNYHRIHSPIKGNILSSWTLGGVSYPVNDWGLKYGKRPLSTNFRLITEMESNYKDVAIVKVGALNVNSIHLTNETNTLQYGDELAYFSFGSTVILLIENENFSFSSHLKEETAIKYGEQIGGYLHDGEA